MKYRELGRTGFRVSEISLGTVEIGMPYGIAQNGDVPTSDENAAARLLHHALDSGVNFIDTARAYGESEAIIGRVLQHRRNEYVLASKVLSHHGEGLPDNEVRELTAASVHESLRLLQTAWIDVMMIHCRANEVVPNPAVFHVLQDLKQQGKIRSVGASVYGEEAALASIKHGGFDSLQIAYSLLDRRPESVVLDLARQAGVGVVARSVLLKGALTDRYRYLPAALGALKAVIQRVEAIANRAQMSLPELAYRYVTGNEMPQTALAGTASVEELMQVIRFAEQGPLSENQMAEIRVIPMPDPHDLNPGNWPAS